jgi:hypothetical protein
MTRNSKRGGSSRADKLDQLERCETGHQAAMHWPGIESLNALVDIVYANGRAMPGHRAMIVAPETRGLSRRITRPLVLR